MPAPVVDAPLVSDGWTLYGHSLFLTELEALITQVEKLCRKDAQHFHQKNATKRLAAIAELAFKVIPQDPGRAEYRQGASLGDEYTHWFRAKFYQQYRLFFRYHRQSRIIIYGWVNNEDTLRAYGSGTDAYRTFRRMLNSGNPPDDWAQLLKSAKSESARLRRVAAK